MRAGSHGFGFGRDCGGCGFREVMHMGFLFWFREGIRS